MGFSRQEYWSGLPFPFQGDLPNSGIEPGSPALKAHPLPTEPPGKPILYYITSLFFFLKGNIYRFKKKKNFFKFGQLTKLFRVFARLSLCNLTCKVSPQASMVANYPQNPSSIHSLILSTNMGWACPINRALGLWKYGSKPGKSPILMSSLSSGRNRQASKQINTWYIFR